MRWSLIVAASIFIVFVETASAQPTPITVEADVITYDSVQQVVVAQGNVRAAFRRYRLFAEAARFDLRTDTVVATGRVRLVDPEGQELRGQALTYNTRTEEGFLEPIEGVLQRRVYVRGDRLDVAPERFVSYEATVTTCDPRRPLYRIVARRIEIVPNREIVAHHASLYLGNVRLFTVPRLAFSLRPDEGVRIPGVGYNEVDGLWIDYRLPVRLAGGAGNVHLKYGALSGPFALLTLTYGYPRYSITTRLGRTQTMGGITQTLGERASGNLLPYDVAEVNVATTAVRIGSTPFSWTVASAAGWYAERLTGVATWRLDGEVSIGSDPIPLGPNLSFAARGTLRVSGYGTGSIRTITTLAATLSYGLDRFTTVGLGHAYVDVRGITPLSIDVVDPASSFSLGFHRAVPDRYRIAATVFHNAVVPETILQAFVGAIVTRSFEIGLFVDYNFRLASFTDIDYTVRWICDCIDVVIRYRQVRREISLEFGLTGFTERGAPFVPRSVPPPPLTLPPP